MTIMPNCYFQKNKRTQVRTWPQFCSSYLWFFYSLELSCHFILIVTFLFIFNFGVACICFLFVSCLQVHNDFLSLLIIFSFTLAPYLLLLFFRSWFLLLFLSLFVLALHSSFFIHDLDSFVLHFWLLLFIIFSFLGTLWENKGFCNVAYN